MGNDAPRDTSSPKYKVSKKKSPLNIKMYTTTAMASKAGPPWVGRDRLCLHSVTRPENSFGWSRMGMISTANHQNNSQKLFQFSAYKYLGPHSLSIQSTKTNLGKPTWMALQSTGSRATQSSPHIHYKALTFFIWYCTENI